MFWVLLGVTNTTYHWGYIYGNAAHTDEASLCTVPSKKRSAAASHVKAIFSVSSEDEVWLDVQEAVDWLWRSKRFWFVLPISDTYSLNDRCLLLSTSGRSVRNVVIHQKNVWLFLSHVEVSVSRMRPKWDTYGLDAKERVKQRSTDCCEVWRGAHFIVHWVACVFMFYKQANDASHTKESSEFGMWT